jgi:hypothetical protein
MRCAMTLISIAVGMPACLFDEHPSPTDAGCPGGAASCPAHPYFHFSGPGKLAAGTEVALRYALDPELTAYDITSSDPSVIAVERDIPDPVSPSVALRSLSAGAATITARLRGAATVLDAVDLTVVDAATIEVRFRASPVSALPIAAIAGVLDTADHLNIDYRDSTGEKLGGHGSFAVSGGDAVAIVAVGSSPGLVSEALEVHDSVGVRFAHLGTATLEISLRDRDPRIALPIEVVAAPSMVDVLAMVLRNGELVVAPRPIAAGEYVGTDIVGRTSDGRFVAGVTAAWSTAPSVSFVTQTTATSPEIVFYAPPPGPLTVTATAGSLHATAQLTAQ